MGKIATLVEGKTKEEIVTLAKEYEIIALALVYHALDSQLFGTEPLPAQVCHLFGWN